jgi:hypothetical protein
MPYNRPGNIFYTTCTRVVAHGAPTVEKGIAGVAIKQNEPPFGTAFGAGLKNVLVGEKFALIVKGVVQVPELAGAVAGDLVHVTTADGTLTETPGAGTRTLGRVIETDTPAGGDRGVDRGIPSGLMRVDLDQKIAT